MSFELIRDNSENHVMLNAVKHLFELDAVDIVFNADRSGAAAARLSKPDSRWVQLLRS